MNWDAAARLERDIDEALARHDLERASALASRYREQAGPYVPDARQPGFRAAYLAARVALFSGRLTDATRHVGPMLPPPPGVPPALARRLWLLSAEALARRGEVTAARGHLERAGRCDDEPLLHLQELRVRLWLGERPDTEGCLRALDQPADRVLLLVERGRAHDADGDLEAAEECWRRAEEMTRSLGASPVRADALIQLGRLAHLRGELQAALDHYEAALVVGPGGPPGPAAHSADETPTGGPPVATTLAPQALEASLRRLLVLLDLGQAERVRRDLARLVPSIDAVPEEVRPLARQLLGLEGGDEAAALDALRRNDLATARVLYSQAHQATTAPVRRARLALALGLVALAQGDAREARPWLEQAHALAIRHQLPEVLWRALQAKGQLAAELDDDDEAARSLFEQAVLASEAQARTLRHRTDAAAHGLRRADLLRRLVRAACRRNDHAAAFRYLELERGRLLLELQRGTRGVGVPRLDEIDRELEKGPSEALLLERDRLLDDYLRDRSRVAGAALPALPELDDLRARLAPRQTFATTVLTGDQAFLLLAKSDGARLVPLGPEATLAAQASALRQCLDAQLRRYAMGLPIGPPERRELDACLEALGDGPLGAALAGDDPLVWVPDGVLHGVPVTALRRNGRYLIEDRVVVHTFSAALFVHHRNTRGRRGGRAVIVTESPDVLPEAGREGDGVAASFWWPTRLRGQEATRAALRKLLPRAGVVHLACHAYFDPQRPLSACVGLPSGETWRGVEWLDEPFAGLPLVTLSACRSAEVGPLVGREVFGLVTGLLSAGVRSVIAGLWPVADREAVPLMWELYRNRMTSSVPDALAEAQRAALHTSPLFWAAFAFFGDADALPAPRGLFAWLARWRQRRHGIRYPRPAEVRHAI